MIDWADARGILPQSQREVAAHTGGSIESVRQWMLHLDEAEVIAQVPAHRDASGLFAANKYRLRIELEHVARLVAHFQPEKNRSPGSANSGSAPLPHVDTGSGNYGLPDAVSGDRHNKEARARSRASNSKSFILEMPEGFLSDNPALRSKVQQLLGVSGIGVDRRMARRLAESLAYEIPRAEAAGYNFENHVVPCIMRCTSYFRPTPLHSFGVIFERELPRELENRARRSARSGYEEKLGGRHRRDSNASAVKIRNAPRAATGAASTTHRAEALRNMIAEYERGVRTMTFMLPSAQRNLTGDELEVALAAMIETARQQLRAMSGF